MVTDSRSQLLELTFLSSLSFISSAGWIVDAVGWVVDAAGWLVDAGRWVVDIAGWFIDAAGWVVEGSVSFGGGRDFLLGMSFGRAEASSASSLFLCFCCVVIISRF